MMHLFVSDGAKVSYMVMVICDEICSDKIVAWNAMVSLWFIKVYKAP